MHKLLILLALSLPAESGTVQGIVLEQASGRPLGRSVVSLEPVPKSGGNGGRAVSARTNVSGQFVFPAVVPGDYFLVASRTAYFPAAYGQRLPAGRGAPVSVTTDSALFAELRMRHKGALTGRVLDENGIGTSGVQVMAYRARLPLRSAGAATSDDRGVFRIGGLNPGKYWVRSGGYAFEDGSGWLPTFGPQGREIRNARIHQVSVDADTAYADINPESGAVFRVSGFVTCPRPASVLVTLSSETGQLSAQTGCGSDPAGYLFEGLAAGRYELFASAGNNTMAAFIEFTLGGNSQIHLSLVDLPELQMETVRKGSGAPTATPARLLARRRSLSQTGETIEIGRGTHLAPGYWEIRGQVPAGQYVDSVVNLNSVRRSGSRAESSSDGYEILVDSTQYASRLRVTVSDQVGQIHGRVTAERKPVPGALVFLWPLADSARRSLGGCVQVVSDTDGNFTFDNLPPGDYRLLASFDVSEVDEEIVQASAAPLIHVIASQPAALELPLWAAPF